MSKARSGNILVIGGIHGREPLGPDLVKLLKQKPVPGVETVIGNPEAVEHGARFVDVDLNRVFPGDPKGGYEQQRAAALLTQSKGFDIVLDFHNTLAADNNCALMGAQAGTRLHQLATTLGFTRLIVATYDCINKYVPQCLSVEISMESPLNDAAIWYDRIADLAENGIRTTPVAAKTFRFVRNVSVTEKQDLGPDQWRNFQQIPARDADTLGVSRKVCAAFSNSGLIQDRYAALIEPIS
jgi:succinylglutamate desuccinylase/aspartoacylase family protein